MAFLVEIVCALGAVVILFLLYLKRNRQYWKRRNVPYIKTSSIWGNIDNLITTKLGLNGHIRNAYREFKKQGHKHGGVHLFLDPNYVPVDPELIKLVLSKDFQHFSAHEHDIDITREPLNENLFSLDGPDWKNMRTKFTPTFTSVKMKMMFPTLLECSGPMIQHINELSTSGKSLDMKDVASGFTMDVVASCAFGVECNSFKDPDSEFRRYGLSLIHRTLIQNIVTITTLFIPSINKLVFFRSTLKELETFFINITKNIIGYRESNNVYRKDFIQLFMEVNEKLKANGETPFSVNQIAAQSFIFFVAGFETSATTMTFCLHELAHNQDIQDKLREEVKENMEKHAGKLTYEGILEMKYMEKVVYETLRKYPAVGVMGRVCTKDYEVPNTDVTIEKGTRVVISISGLHSDEEYYPNPNKFDPERFNEENTAKRQPFTYLPFGEGPRICIGLRFGLMQAKTGLALILKNFRIVPVKGEPYNVEFDPNAFVTSTKKGVLLNAVKLDS